MTEALTSNYWISPNAVRITLNAMGMKDYIQCGATGGAVIMCYMRDIDGLGYDAGHNYRRWPIVTAPVYFNSWTRKYVYIAIPRSTAVGTSAILVFPSKRIDLYGMTEPAEGKTEGEQIGSKDYYYIFLRGVISPSRSDGGADQLREWEEYVDYGTLSTDQQVSEGDSEWWRYNADDDTVTFLKVITNATFKVLNVLKNLTVGGDGSFGGSLSVAKDAVVGGLLTAVSAVINSIKSTNYSGSGMADTGWSITNDNGSGSSEAVFDYLTVRKKMTINSLEIKETHFTAGDICQSLATAEIVRTDYYYVDPDSGEMEKLGYSKYRVPWLLKGLALVLGKRAQNMKIFSRWKTVRINLTRNELLRCNRVRCYFLAKDGEREIENWWRENDLARCQTWNMTKAQRNTFIPNFNDHAGNIYWWRTVKNTSWNTGLPRYLLTDGDGNPKDPSDLNNTTTDPDDPNIYRNEAGLKYEVTNGTYNNEKGTQSYKDHQPAVIDGKTYHWIDIAFDGSREIDDNGRLVGDRTGWCDANSDIPAAGDKVVQFGNTVDPDRMNLMLWEVNGSGNMDAPDWKMYAGIYTFDLNLCWWGGTPQKTKWSYRTGIRVYAPKFEWITEYGIAKQAFDRGHWTELPLERDDDTRLHEDDLSFYPEYPDDIKNPDGTFKSRKNGEPRNFIRKCHYYDRVSHEGSMWLCSINETNYWIAKETFTTADQVSYTKGDRISNFSSLSTEDKTHCEQVRNYTFDEPSIASLDWTEVVEKGDDGSFKSRVFCRSNDTPLAPSNEVKTVSGITYNTFSNPVPPPVTGQPRWHDGAPDGTAILWSSTAWFYPNGTHTEWTTPSPETDTADLDIEFSPNYNKPDAPYSGNDFTPEMRGNGTAYGVKDATHSNKRANGSGEDANWYDPTADANNTHADWNDMIWRAERKIKNGEYIGSWSITRIKGEHGDTPVTAYRWYKEEAVATTAPTAPTGESANPTATDHTSDSKAYPAATWSENAPNRPATGWCLYMTTSYRFDDGTYGQWTTPIRISGTDGTPGEDAENVEWIYRTSPDTNVTIPTNSPNQKGYVPAGWTNHPTGIDATNIYEFACFRILPEGANVDDTKVWSKWMGILGTGSQGDTPIIWSHWGRNGMDGDGFEYVFVRTTTNTAPTIVVKADSYTDSNGHKFTDDEFLPKALVNGTEVECSDDPQSIDPVNKYVWVAKRTKGAANTDTGVRTWEKYSGTMSLWNHYAENAIRLDLDNEMDSVQTDSQGKILSAREVSTVIRLWDGATEVDISAVDFTASGRISGSPASTVATFSQAASGKGKQLKWTFIAEQSMPTAYEITISYVYLNETHRCTLTIAASMGQPVYQLKPSRSSLPCTVNSNNVYNNPPALSLSVVKVDGASTDEITTIGSGGTIESGTIFIRYSLDSMPTGKTAGSAWPTANSVQATSDKENVYIAMFNAAGTLLDRETIPIVKDGKNGENAVRLDLDNENDSMLYTGDGTLVSGNVISKAYMFDGANDVSSQTTWSATASGCIITNASKTSRDIEVTGMTAATAKVTVQGIYKDSHNNTHTKTAVLTLKKIADGDKYDLIITPNSIAYNSSTDTPDASTIDIQVWKTSVNSSGGVNRVQASPPTGYAVYAGSTALTAVSTGKYSYTTDNSAISEVQVKIAKTTDLNDILDAETITVNKAKNGEDAEIVTVYQEAESTPAKPTGSTIPPTGWSLTEPRVGYNATEKMDELRLVNTDTDIHTLSRKYIVINNTSAKVKLGIKLILGGTVYSNSEGVAVYDGNTKVAEQAGRTGTKDNVSIEIDANAKKVYEVRLTRAGSYSAHTIYGCFAFTGGGMNISPMYVWQSHAVFHGTTISDDGWSDPVTYTAKNGDNADTEKEEFVYIRSKQCDVYPTTDSNSLDINRKNPSEDEYLPWVGNYGSGNPNQFERNYWSDDPSGINNTWPYEFQAHRVKTNGVWGAFGDIKLYQSLGEKGKDGWMVTASPANVLITQSLGSDISTFSEAIVGFTAKKGNVDATVSSIGTPTSDTFNVSKAGSSGSDAKKVKITSPKTHGTPAEYYTDGVFTVTVNITDPDTNSNVAFEVTVPCYANLLGTWKEQVEGDTWSAIASKTFYYYDSNDDLVKATTIGEYINSSSTNSSNLKTLLNGIVSDESYIRQTADAINMGVTNGWKNYINDPVAATRVTSTNTDDDSIFGKVAKVATTHTIERASELNEKSVTWFCVVGINANGSLTFGSAGGGASAVQISKNNSGVSVTSVFNNTYAKGDTSGCTFVGQSTNGTSWYLCWTNATLVSSLGATNNQAAFGSLPSGWRIYYAGIVMGSGCPSIDMIKQGAGLTKAGIDITQGKITATANTFEIKNNSGTKTFEIDSNGNLVGAGNAKFNGNIEATGGKIGGFDIGQNDLKNTNYGAGITIQNAENNPTKVVQIGNDATDEITGNKCSMIAESKGSNTYNTALYLNAQGATYNYAFHGNGNGVLNGFVQGYKVKAISNIGASTYLSLRDGQTQAIISVGIDGRKNVYLPTLGDCRATLGLKDNDTDFCCRLTVINQTAIQSTNYNRDNISIVGGTHEYTDQITNIQTRPRLLYTSHDTALEIQSAVSCDLIITYINKRFIASYIKTQW